MMTLRVFLICSIGLVFTNSLESHPVHHIDPVDNDAYPHLNRRGLLKSSDEPRNVIVILKDRSVSEVRASLKRKTHLDETKAIVNNLKRKQDALVGEMEMRGGKVIQQYQHALNGIRIHITQDNEQRLKGHPDVADILPLRTFQRRNVESVPFLGVPQIWNLAPLGIGLHGEGIKVGIIDTGIDYTHANFGGPGTVDAYNVAMAGSNQTANAAMFGPSSPKVKGGYDFAGDNYDGTNTPTPDSNPLDCQGHGSHVAGTVGGFGVMSDGTTYTGSYDESIYTPNAFLIGPGVAPLVDLYAYRVFGCSGYTDLVVDAIDRAIADDVDVINMSLGSDFGFDSALFADIVASNNAVRAGIIVVTASGNSGPIPYITGSPASADSAIAVAAIDSHETYPGANITTVDGKFISVQNSNNFALVDGTIYTLIIIKDNPSTAHYDESLGCNVGDFPSSMPPSTLVVVNRGVCGRAAKAINGQHAGAAAVIMINTDLTGYPPFEGSVPDLNIPFFGAELSDNATLMLYNDTQVSLKNIQLPNPTAATVTSFSSGGPRGGDSYLKPEIAGPGARIVSTAIGTGYKGLTLSGTSMATPHVAGVAALVRQAHPTWTAVEIKAAIMSTANATRIVGLNPRLAGAGLVNPVAAIQTNVWAAGVASSDHFGATAVNFGYVELTSILHSVKGFVNLCNRGNDSVSFVASVGNINGVPHIVSLNSTLIQLDGSQNATIGLTLQIPATTAGNSSGFYDASGTIIFTPLGSGNNGVPLSVPYYIVPRSISSLNASIQQLGGNASHFNVSVNNSNGPIAAQSVNLFSWGIHVDEDTNSTYSSVRAVGVISMPNPNGSVTNPIIQFAVNTYKRWSSPSTVAFDIYIDADPQNMNGIDYVVRSIDYGLFNSANPVGKLGTFILSTRSPGYYTLDPGATYASTDSSVIIIPLWRSFLCRQKEPCVNSTNARFSYQIRSYDMIFGTNWSYTALGWYNPFSSSITFSSPKMGPIGFGAANISIVRINPSVWNSTPALGVLVVAADNKSGRDQAIELAFPKPTGMPSIMPTKIPSAKPSRQPTVNPIANPTATPIANPTKKPLAKPTAKPVPKPTQKPSTTHPSAAPTKHPRRKSRRPRVRKSRRPRHVRKSRRPRTLGSTA